MVLSVPEISFSHARKFNLQTSDKKRPRNERNNCGYDVCPLDEFTEDSPQKERAVEATDDDYCCLGKTIENCVGGDYCCLGKVTENRVGSDYCFWGKL